MLSFILLVVGFVVLTKGADYLVDGAASLAKRYGISDLVIGLTVVSFGTSAPEMFVNLAAVLKGSPDIAMGNIIGSNISNILLILGIAALIYPLPTSKGTVWKEIPFGFLAAAVLTIMLNDLFFNNEPSQLSRNEGLVLIAFFCVFLYYTGSIAFEVKDTENLPKTITFSLPKAVCYLAIGFLGLVLGGWLIVENAVQIAQMFGMSEAMIGLTVIAIGTSLPELATSAVAAYKKNADIAIGNVVGSNIFNIFLILGITGTIKPLPFNEANHLDLMVMLTASGVLFIFMFTGKKFMVDRWEGGILVLSYIAYLVYNIIKI